MLNEAIENALNHGQAKRVAVKMENNNNVLQLTVSNDGLGFDVNSTISGRAAGHFGIAGMRERAKRAGADFQITSSAGKGTVVSLQLVLQGKKSNRA